MQAESRSQTTEEAATIAVAGVATPRSRRAPLPLRLLRTLFQRLGPVVPSIMGRFAFWLWFRPSRRGESRLEAAIVSEAEQRTVSSNGRTIAVYSWGDGPTVLLVHGWNGRAAQLASFVRPLTSAGYRVVALDAPAHGRSPGRRTDAFEIAEALATLDRFYGPFTAVVSHSMGALCCATAMSSDRLRTQRVACLAPAMSRASLVFGFGKILHLPGSVLSDLTERVNAFVTPGFWNQVVTTPVLLVHDLEDDFVPYSDVATLESRWPAARLVTTRGLGHNRMLRDPRVIHHVVKFVTDG